MTAEPGYSLDGEIVATALDGLARFLSTARQVDRLLLMFADDRWLGRRVVPDLMLWDGYQSDLDITWDAVERGRDQHAPEEPGNLLAACARLALIRSTVTAADDVPLELLAAAARTGVWTLGRVLATISRYGQPSRRAAGYLQMLALAATDRNASRLIGGYIAELAALPPPEVPARTLLAGVGLLEPATRDRVLQCLEGTATIVADGMVSEWAPEQVTASEVLALLRDVPDARRPALVARLADVLLMEAERQAADPAPQPQSRHRARVDKAVLTELLRDAYTAQDLQRPVPTGIGELRRQVNTDFVEALRDPHERDRLYEALEELAGLVGLLPDQPSFLSRLRLALAGADDSDGTAHLMAAYAAAAAEHAIEWGYSGRSRSPAHPESPKRPSQDPVDEQARERRALQREYMRQGGWPNADSRRWAGDRERKDSPGPTAAEASRKAAVLLFETVRRAADRGRGSEREGTADEEGPVLGTGTTARTITGRYGRVPIIAIVAYAVLAGHSDEAVIEMAADFFRPEEVHRQVQELELECQQSTDRPVASRIIRLLQEGLLRQALDEALVRGVVQAAWNGIPEESLRAINLDRILGYVLTLPAEATRNAVSYVLTHAEIEPSTALGRSLIPLLTALELVLPHLNEEQVGRAFATVMSLGDPEVRRTGIGLLAARLGTEEVATALSALAQPPDAREQAWALAELGGALDPAGRYRRRTDAWTAHAATQVRSGFDFARSMLPHLAGTVGEVAPASVLGDAALLAALRAMDPNNRLDAILGLTRATEGQLPAEFAAVALELPAVSFAEKFSCRATALAGICGRLPAALLPAAWQAAREVPERLRVGDARLFGFHWSSQYPLAAAAHALAPRARGTLAHQIFAAACEMPWEPREEIFQILAENADEELARRLFDFSLLVHQAHKTSPIGPGPGPYELQGTWVVEPIEEFLTHREVRLAEMIAAIASRLDGRRLAIAAECARTFTNAGPRSWLPARLLPLMQPEQCEPMLSTALLAALDFLSGDPSRPDVLTDLLPYAEAEASRRESGLRAFISSRFAGLNGVILDEDQLASLGTADRDSYLKQLGIDEPRDLEVRQAFNNDEAMLRSLTRIILSPAYWGNFQSAITSVIGMSPVDSRLDAITAMREELAEDFGETIIDKTLEDLQHEPMDAWTRARVITAIAPLVNQDRRDQLVDFALQLDGPDLDRDEAAARDFFTFLFSELGQSMLQARHYAWNRFSLTWAVIHERDQREGAVTALNLCHGARVELLQNLMPLLSPAGQARVAAAALELPEVEVADAIATLLPSAQESLEGDLIGALFSLSSPMAKMWALFKGAEHLQSRKVPGIAEFAWTTAMSFDDPLSKMGCLLMLGGYADPVARKDWTDWVLSQVAALPDADATRVMAALAWFSEKNPETSARIAACLCARTSDDATYSGLLELSRLGVDFHHATPEQLAGIRASACRRLRKMSSLSRRELLETLATESTAFTAICTEDEIFSIAESIQEICHEWHWPHSGNVRAEDG